MTEHFPILLDGTSLTMEQVIAVACDGAKVALSAQAMEEICAARQVVLSLADGEKQIYGLNTGLGANKDRKITSDDFSCFNRQILFSHSVALPPYAARVVVRATMLCRLNGMLVGVSGVDPKLPKMLCDMLNSGIHPQLPLRGSVGLADLGNLAYIGLAMIGEGNVEYCGEVMPAGAALKQAGLSPVQLGPKDGLPIVSSNAFAVAQSVLLYAEIRDLLCMAEGAYALTYEAQSYNPMFLDPRSLLKRPLPGQRNSLSYVRACLEGSSLWTSKNESLSGSISFKAGYAVYGVVHDALSGLEQMLPNYLNSSDDCPAVLCNEQEMISTANYVITGLAVAWDAMAVALAHLSNLIANQIMRLDNPAFSGLPRFLRPEEKVIAYGTVQKTVSSLNGELRHLANPGSLDSLPTANESEDHGCNAPYVLRRTEKMVDILRYMVAIEALHGAQAADLAEGCPSGAGTKLIYDAVRAAVPFLEEDNRDLGADIQAVYELVREKRLLYCPKENALC